MNLTNLKAIVLLTLMCFSIEAVDAANSKVKLHDEPFVSRALVDHGELRVTTEEAQGQCTQCHQAVPKAHVHGKANLPKLTDYYVKTNTKSPKKLRQSLQRIVRSHVRLYYKEIWNLLEETDQDPNNPDNVILFYTRKSIPKSHKAKGQTQGQKDFWNREHVWSQSHGLLKSGSKTDAHNLVPADQTVNSSRGNKDFENGGNAHHECALCLTDGDSWEPPEEIKGDVARMMFYMDLRYEGARGENDLTLVEGIPEEDSDDFGDLATLMSWHCGDAVSHYELARNEIIYEWQQNRNPFIDQPQWAEYIFGFECVDQ